MNSHDSQYDPLIGLIGGSRSSKRGEGRQSAGGRFQEIAAVWRRHRKNSEKKEAAQCCLVTILSGGLAPATPRFPGSLPLRTMFATGPTDFQCVSSGRCPGSDKSSL